MCDGKTAAHTERFRGDAQPGCGLLTLIFVAIDFADYIAHQASLPEEMVRDIIRKVDRNEYKRQQAAPGLRITAKAFGMGRRFPIAHRFTE